MLAAIESGAITGIVVYHGDRLLRTQEDLLTLIKLARTRGIHLASPALRGGHWPGNLRAD